MRASQPGKTLRRFFSGVAEHVFQSQLGVADPPLTDYISDLLMQFVRTEALARVRTATGRPAKYVTEMLAEADQRLGDARREVHRHIGDYTLYWTGLFPESLRRRRGNIDQFDDYCSHGKRAYLIASTIETDRDDAPGELLERLGHQFEMCAYGLREVRREWERRDDSEWLPLLIN